MKPLVKEKKKTKILQSLEKKSFWSFMLGRICSRYQAKEEM
jgi:hypothetical protein